VLTGSETEENKARKLPPSPWLTAVYPVAEYSEGLPGKTLEFLNTEKA
jgi:hypothetical protein